MIGRVVSGILQSLPRATISSQPGSLTPALWNPWNLTFVRNIIKYNFPRASERKRIKTHGWLARMATPGGRKILMRRILKGKHVLSH
ncbi:hypothetical protein DMN91_003388 [Ooceraea biroi]|uniref:Large ribosomal subunit protein bL34m n=1 Tax=Ooceraea biroi TaxID=2015173 RepID=A0A3L8DYV0_OOCBI|nr:uncharacterized protein LOC105284412 [Ooceraea biroi]RLU25295.1 hypothetical protein DMN91_003388 [Ooceraea biroi]